MKTPILETEKLILRPLVVTDAENVFRNWATDSDVAKFMTWSVHENVEITKMWLKEVESKIDDGSRCAIKVMY